jgi:hypothetical protein
MPDINGQTLSELNASGESQSSLAARFNMTKGQVAGLIYRYRQEQGIPVNEEKSSVAENENGLFVTCDSTRIYNQEELIKKFAIDTESWELIGWIASTTEAHRKDRKVDWIVQEGQVVTGEVHDTGKLVVVPLYHVKAQFRKRHTYSQDKIAIQEFITKAETYSPTYEPVVYPPDPDPLMYELDLQDIHFGRQTWAEESGGDYDLNLARKAVESVVVKLLDRVKRYRLEKILIPLGNDFFNVDNKHNTTTAGTPQQETDRWQKTYRAGLDMAVWIIDTCRQVAPVEVLMVPGNHEIHRNFYLGETLRAWYRNDPNVQVDNRAVSRKYYQYGVTLLGFAHGKDERLERLPLLMALDAKELWAQTSVREWHTGDKHHKKDFAMMADEGSGVTVRILRSLAVDDAWTFNAGFKSIKASESFLWDKNEGLMAQFTATPTM